MQTIGNLTAARSILLAAGAFLCLITLSGCGGGGGGGFVSTPAVPYVYPNSLTDATSSDTVDGFITPYALNTSTNAFALTQPFVSGASPSKGIITITVNAITLPDNTTEPAFSVEFDPTATITPLSNTPFDKLSPKCASCLKTATANAIVSGSPTPTLVTFTYIDPSASGLNYSVLGIWEKPTTNNGGAPDPYWPEVGGAFSAGVLTRGIDLPTTGSASYSGYFLGRYVTSAASGLAPAGTYLVGANANATANFGVGTVSFSTSNTNIALDSGGGTLGIPSPVPGLDLTSTPMAIIRTSSSNSFGGTVGTTSGGLSGPIRGGFYGPPATSGDFAPPELGGSLSVSNSSLDQNMAGSFALHK